MPRVTSIVLLIVLAVTLSGCLATGLSISFAPDPVVLKPGDDFIEGELIIKMTGYGIVNVEDVSVQFIGRSNDGTDGEVINAFSLEINSSIPVSSSATKTRVLLPVSYDSAISEGLSELRFVVSGRSPSATSVMVQYDED